MHRAKTSRLPKFITSLLAVFALILGGAVVGLTPAQAITNGCISSGFQPQNCYSQRTPITDIVSLINTSASTSATVTGNCVGPTFTLAAAATPSTYVTSVAGLNFTVSGTTATLSGTTQGTAFPTTNYVILATCTSGSNNAEAFTFSVTVTTSATPLILPSTQSIDATTNTAITNSAAYTALNFGGTPIVYSVSPTLPTGLSLNTTNGIVSGTPTTAQTATPYTITATYSAAIATATITITVTAPAPAPVVEPEPPTRKVTICHRTHSETNPYVRITVDYNSVNKKSGHQGHDEIFAGEHVFKAGIYKRAKDKLWGDIIPMDSSGLNRWQPLNWTALGAQIYSGAVAGCPSYDPVAYYNAQREAGVPEKKLKQEMADIEAELKEGNPGTSRVDPTTLKYTGNNSAVAEQENDKVTICHRTHATTNPYVRITVSTSSVTNPAGHYSHDEIYDGHHVYDSAVTYPNNQKLWGDIIPADPTGKNRWQPLNWTPLGQSIYEGKTAGCGEQTVAQLYNSLRESGMTKKQVIEELEKQKSVDVDPKEIDEVEYTGSDPKTKESEPKTPSDPGTAPTQSLSGMIWLDRNKDGVKDPDEPYLPNVEVTLAQTGAKVKTDANGYYVFTDLAPGDYKVVTTIPTDLLVTYDSEGLNQGEMNATVPTGGRAFTWAGLVGSSEVVDKQTMEILLTNNPKAIPLEEVPAWLKSKIQGLLNPEKFKQQQKTDHSNLAETGSNVLAIGALGLLMLFSGLVLRRRAQTKR